jgi:hypothetical protein
MFEDRPTQWVQLFGSFLAGFFALVIYGFSIKRRGTKKKQKLPTKTLLYMEIVAFSLAFAAFIDGIFLLTDEILNIDYVFIEDYAFVNLGSYISFSLNAVANYFLFAFAKAVYGEQIKKWVYFTLSFIQIMVVPMLLLVYFLGPFLFANVLNDIELIPFLTHILCSIIIYILFSVNAFKIRRLMPLDSDQDFIIRKSLGDLGTTGIFMLLAVLSFVTHELFIMTDIEILKNEAITIAFGWIFGAIAAFFLYSGYVSPEMMKKRID